MSFQKHFSKLRKSNFSMIKTYNIFLYHLVYASSISENRLEYPKINLGGSGAVYGVLVQKLHFFVKNDFWRGQLLKPSV